MFGIRKETLERLCGQYPAGTRVELTHMNDPWNTRLHEGCRGTVTGRYWNYSCELGLRFLSWRSLR